MEEKGSKAARTRQKLIQAARELIAANGYDAVSVDQIVERCGVAKGTFYHHFKSKEALAHHICATLYSDLRQETEALTTCSPLEKLSHFVDSWHKSVAIHNIHFARQAIKLYTDPAAVGEHGEKVSQMEQGIALVEELLTQAVAAGELTPGTPVGTLAKAIMFAMQGSTIYHCKHGEDFDVLAWNQEFHRHILTPLLAPCMGSGRENHGA